MRHSLAATLLGVVLVGALPAAAGTHVYVTVAPPAAIVEVHPVAPSARHVWLGGYHRWDGKAYVWVPGRWAIPPAHHHTWIPGHWAHANRGWYWSDGHWR